jgi:mono/diheme cytochrome c family protein
MKLVLMFALAGAVGAAAGSGAADPRAPIGAAQDSLGKQIFTGKGLCTACHGPEAKGTALAPNLTDAEWLHADGTVESIARVITQGVPTPKKHPAPMPPKGGAQLSDAEIQAVARYVASLSSGS